MKKETSQKKTYERPCTIMVAVEVEGTFASSVTEYENAGSAGSGEHADNPFSEFGSSSSNGGGAATDSFDSWSSYN